MKSFLLRAFFIICFCLAVGFCFYLCFWPQHVHVVEEHSVGNITNIAVVATSFNERQKTQIYCEKAVVVVDGIVSAELNQPAQIDTDNNGRKWLEIGSKLYLILGM